MAYPERKPIYEAYEKIIESIVEKQKFKEYAHSEIEALDKALLESFRMIREKKLLQQYGPKLKS